MATNGYSALDAIGGVGRSRGCGKDKVRDLEGLFARGRVVCGGRVLCAPL